MQTTDNFEGQFATRARAGEINAYFSLLPDPDPVLRRKGIDVSALRPLLADPHLESVSSVRVAAVSSTPWRLIAGGEDAAAAKALALAEESFAGMDIPGIIEEAMESVFYGFKPLEVLWDTVGRWIPSGIVGKPPEWFGFDQDNVLVFKGKTVTYEEIPPYRIVCARHRASYDNPLRPEGLRQMLLAGHLQAGRAGSGGRRSSRSMVASLPWANTRSPTRRTVESSLSS